MELGSDVVVPESTVVVSGYRRVALINVRRRTLMRLSLRAWEKVAASDAATAENERIKTRLVETGYLEYATSLISPRTSIRTGNQCLTPPAKTLIISGGFVTNAKSVEIVRELIGAGFTSHVIVLYESSVESSSAKEEIIKSFGVPYEIGYSIGRQLETKIFSKSGRQIGTRKANKEESHQIRFQLALDYKSLLVNSKRHEGYGFVFIDKAGIVWPSWLESTVSFGHLSEFSFPSPGESSLEFQRYSSNHKGLRDVCMDCELREACIWSAALRVDAKNIRSAPRGCQYEPRLESFQYEKF
ncbi:MAG: hypothetical protein EPO30_10525 [Lysobacteraceae bacterium]|nr:MAG: hypothetical protein EPO30_10525 [Xanthomonadaceae bacterium]